PPPALPTTPPPRPRRRPLMPTTPERRSSREPIGGQPLLQGPVATQYGRQVCWSRGREVDGVGGCQLAHGFDNRRVDAGHVGFDPALREGRGRRQQSTPW